MKINLNEKINEYNESVKSLKEKLEKAQNEKNAEDSKVFESRLHQVASERWALKILFVDTISKTFNLPLEDIFELCGQYIDVSKLNDYSVFVTAEKL